MQQKNDITKYNAAFFAFLLDEVFFCGVTA